LPPRWNSFTWQTLLCEYPLHRIPFADKKRTTERCSSVVNSSSTSSFWILKPASEHVHVHLVTRLLRNCYLVIHMKNPLCPLQLFYFHLWPIYWLALIYIYIYNISGVQSADWLDIDFMLATSCESAVPRKMLPHSTTYWEALWMPHKPAQWPRCKYMYILYLSILSHQCT
jgi:hypothetical protein